MMLFSHRLFFGVALSLVVLLYCGLISNVSATSCQCFIAAQPNTHCSSSFTSKVAVVRALVTSTSDTASALMIEEVLFNNSPQYFYMGQEVKVSTPSCTPSVQTASKYFIRITVNEDGSLTIAACDYVVPESSVSDTSVLSCGQTLTDCQRYPCPTDTPKCESSTIACITTPCPQRTCGACNIACPIVACLPGSSLVTLAGECCPICVPNNSTCTNVACPAIACADGNQLVKNQNDCCGTCVPCSGVQCPLLGCGPGFSYYTPPGQCCATQCVQSCQMTACAAAYCQPGEQAVIPDGQCCPVCQPCSIACSALYCPDGSHPELIANQGPCGCNSRCVPNSAPSHSVSVVLLVIMMILVVLQH